MTSQNDNSGSSWVERATVAAVVGGLALVVLAPLAMSFHSLAGWGREALGLTYPLAYAVPLTLDAAAVVCVGLTFHAMLRGDSAGAARLLVWVFAGASSFANWRHGSTISADAAVYYASMPQVAALLLDISLRRVRRTALAHLGALERPLPRYRAVRWVVAPLETWRAWRTAVRQGITDPNEALAVADEQRADRQAPKVLLATSDDAEPAPMSQAEAVRQAFEALGEIDARKAVAWLAERGVTVAQNYAYTLARRAKQQQDDRRPALTAVAGN